MKVEDLYLAGVGTWLPPAMTLVEAAARGLCDLAKLAPTGILSATVSNSEAAPEMAARAARLALDRSGVDPGEVGLLLYANTYYQGHDMWSAASYVQRIGVGRRGTAVEIHQMSNGGMAALELASVYLSARRDRTAALAVAADRFCPPGIDRWNSDPGTVYGDGGAAVVLSRQGGFARLRSLVMVSEPELEGMHRGDDPFGPVPFSHREPIDLLACQRAFMSRVGLGFSVSRIVDGQQEAMDQALEEAGVGIDRIDWFVLPHLGRRRLQASYLSLLGVDDSRTTWSFSRQVGHLGAGDQFAGIGHLVDAGLVGAGHFCLLLGVGAGYTWSAAVIEVMEPAPWARRHPGRTAVEELR